MIKCDYVCDWCGPNGSVTALIFELKILESTIQIREIKKKKRIRKLEKGMSYYFF